MNKTADVGQAFVSDSSLYAWESSPHRKKNWGPESLSGPDRDDHGCCYLGRLGLHKPNPDCCAHPPFLIEVQSPVPLKSSV